MSLRLPLVAALGLPLLLLLLLLLLPVPMAESLPAYDEDAAWDQFRRYLLRLDVDTDEDAEDVEPDSDWIKTCAGWTAQEMCSTVFGSGIAEETAYAEDLGLVGRVFGSYHIDYEERSVTGTCNYLNPEAQTYKSIFREGIGCTLVERLSEEEIRAQDLGDMTPPEPLDPQLPWPEGEGYIPEGIPEGVDMDCIRRVAAEQFADELANPRAIVVVWQGYLIYEEYAPGITKDNRLLGWSATKSLTQALIGIVVGDGLLDIYEPAPVPEWNETPGDERANITIDMMLRMSSGTRWVGDLPPSSQCLFWSDADCAHVCAIKPLVYEPDTVWNYNSGSSYILSRIALENRRDQELTNFEWPKRRLFYPIGAHSMYIEYQANELYLGGAYGYATARDWARFGLLFQRGGVWIDGNRILPEGWAEYSGAATHTYANYGAHFWKMPSVDENLFYASGFRNQNVFIFPDHELVIVRFAMPPLVYLLWQTGPFLNDMLSCFDFNATKTSHNF